MTRERFPLVLASASPRRRELLAQLGLDVIFAEPQVDESGIAGEPPSAYALRLAALKARAVAPRFPAVPVLAADTVVALGERSLGKPTDRSDARAMLLALSGRTHVVITALALAFEGAEVQHLDQALVRFVPPNYELLGWYLASGEGDDKAGAYAAQGKGAVLIERIEGNFQAVVGLPLAPLPGLFARVGLALAAHDGRLAISRRP
jgi:septum formation protein